MSIRSLSLLTGIVLLAIASTARAMSPLASGSGADAGRGIVVVVNAKVFTVNRDQPEAAAFAYDQHGLIIAVGNEAKVMAAAGAQPTIIDARGNRVLPGFQDTHVHVPEAGINSGLCPLEPGQTLGE